MSLNSLWDFEAKMPKDDKMLPLDVRRFRSNMIGKYNTSRYCHAFRSAG